MAKGGQQTQSQTVDPGTRQYVDQMRQLALGYVMPGQSPGIPASNPALDALRARGGMGGRLADQLAQRGGTLTPMASQAPTINPALQNQYQQLTGLGAAGIGALTGGANPFMNTYMGALNPVYDQIRSQTLGSIGDQATQAGAFGGSRHGVAEGVALGQIGQQQAAANIDAFNQSQQRALQSAQLGLGATDLGRYLMEYPQLFQSRQLGLLGQAIGPYGTTTSQPTTSSPLAGAAGGALAGSQFGPWGALIGGGLGLLGGFN